MKRRLETFMLLAVLVLACMCMVPRPAVADPDDAPEQSSEQAAEQELEQADGEGEERELPPVPPGPDILTAQAAMVADSSGNVIWEYNAYAEMPLASITKIMTAMVALDSGIPLDTELSLQNIAHPPGSQEVGIEDGDTATLEELLTILLVFSANDAADNIALAVAGSEEAFAELMNQKAAELGMEHTHFVNPHGLEVPEHYSCAADVVTMGRYAMQNYPFIVRVVRLPETKFTVYGQEETFSSTDRLMPIYAGLLGIKTGATENGMTFAGAATRGGVTLYSSVLGCLTGQDRWDATSNLLNYGFESYEPHQVAESQLLMRQAPFAYRFGYTCPVRISLDLYAALPKGSHLKYLRMTQQPNILVEPETAYGSMRWQGRSDSPVACSVYAGELQPTNTAYLPFILPFMAEHAA